MKKRQKMYVLTALFVLLLSACKYDPPKTSTAGNQEIEQTAVNKETQMLNLKLEEHVKLNDPPHLSSKDRVQVQERGIVIEVVDGYSPGNSEMRYYQSDGKIIGAAGNGSECSNYNLLKIKYTDDGMIRGVLLAEDDETQEEDSIKANYILNFMATGDTTHIKIRENIDFVRNDQMEVIGMLNQNNPSENFFIKETEELDWSITQTDDFWVSDINGGMYTIYLTVKDKQPRNKYRVVTYDKFKAYKEDYYNDTTLVKSRQYSYCASCDPPKVDIYERELMADGGYTSKYYVKKKGKKAKVASLKKVSFPNNTDTIIREFENQKMVSEKLIRKGRVISETQFSRWGTPLEKKEYEYVGDSARVNLYKINYKTKMLKRVK